MKVVIIVVGKETRCTKSPLSKWGWFCLVGDASSKGNIKVIEWPLFWCFWWRPSCEQCLSPVLQVKLAERPFQPLDLIKCGWEVYDFTG